MKRKLNGSNVHRLFDDDDQLREMVEPKPEPKKDKPKGDPAVGRCVKAFYAAYVRRHNPLTAERWLAEMDAGVKVADRTTPQSAMLLPLIKGAKDGALMKKLLAAYGEERVLRLIDDFFGECYTMFGVINSNQDVGALFAAAPRLVVREHARQQPSRTVRNLDAAARAMGRRPRPFDKDRLTLPPAGKAKD